MAKNKKQSSTETSPEKLSVRVTHTMKAIYPTLPDDVKQGYKDFLAAKAENPLQRANSTDKRFTGNNVLGKYSHAHIGRHNYVLVYRLGGKPTTMVVYAVLTHDDLGIGTKPSQSRIQAWKNKFEAADETRLVETRDVSLLAELVSMIDPGK